MFCATTRISRGQAGSSQYDSCQFNIMGVLEDTVDTVEKGCAYRR